MRDFRLSGVLVTVVTTLIVCSTKSAVAQFGKVEPVKAGRAIASGSVVAVVSPKNDYVVAYSKHTGIWQKQKVETRPENDIHTTMTARLVVFEADEKVYAFSATEGRWEAVSVKGSEEPTVAVHPDMVVVEAGNQVHVFSDETANWASVTIEFNE